jgi:hypothetical protein
MGADMAETLLGSLNLEIKYLKPNHQIIFQKKPETKIVKKTTTTSMFLSGRPVWVGHM